MSPPSEVGGASALNAAAALTCPVPPCAMLKGDVQLTVSVPLELIGLPVTLNSPGMDKPILVTVPPLLEPEPPLTLMEFVAGS